MTFTVGTITRCTGQNHFEVPLTIGGNTFTLHTTKQEVEAIGPTGFAEAKEAILARLKSAVKEAGATTFAQVKAALEGNTYQV